MLLENKAFDYFFYENYDAEMAVDNAENPRLVLGENTDAVLSYMGEDKVSAENLEKCFENHYLNQLINVGVLKKEQECYWYDSPIFLSRDAELIRAGIQREIPRVIEKISLIYPQLCGLCEKIDNGCTVEENMYHILCGMILDGYMFEELSKRNAIAISRKHESNLDYLVVIYEKCRELEMFSDQLLCSYNRLVNSRGSLQSFGDAAGDRFDFYRFMRWMDLKKVPNEYKNIEELLQKYDKNVIIDEVISFIKTGVCKQEIVFLLETFHYTYKGKICVPVFEKRHHCIIEEIASVVIENIAAEIEELLNNISSTLKITAVRHGVCAKEIANELYHIVFGEINEQLVKRGLVKEPDFIQREGRYLKCIELYE